MCQLVLLVFLCVLSCHLLIVLRRLFISDLWCEIPIWIQRNEKKKIFCNFLVMYPTAWGEDRNRPGGLNRTFSVRLPARAVTALNYVKRPHIGVGPVNPLGLTQKLSLNCATKIELTVIGVVLIQISRCFTTQAEISCEISTNTWNYFKKKVTCDCTNCD